MFNSSVMLTLSLNTNGLNNLCEVNEVSKLCRIVRATRRKTVNTPLYILLTSMGLTCLASERNEPSAVPIVCYRLGGVVCEALMVNYCPSPKIASKAISWHYYYIFYPDFTCT